MTETIVSSLYGELTIGVSLSGAAKGSSGKPITPVILVKQFEPPSSRMIRASSRTSDTRQREHTKRSARSRKAIRQSLRVCRVNT